MHFQRVEADIAKRSIGPAADTFTLRAIALPKFGVFNRTGPHANFP